MKKNILLTLTLVVITINVWSQNYFEGQIDYKVEYNSLNENIPENYLELLFGNKFTAYIKEDKYLMIYNSSLDKGWTKNIIRLDEGYAYIEYENSDTIYRSTLSGENEKLIDVNKVKGDRMEILGEICPSIKLAYESTDSGFPGNIAISGTHYYNPKYKLNPEKYEVYTSGFWNLYVQKAKAISIRNEKKYEGFFESVSEATRIDEKDILEEIFVLDDSKIIVDME